VSDTGVAPEGRGLKMHSSGKKQIAVGMHAIFFTANACMLRFTPVI